MSKSSKTILERANEAITRGNYEGFLSFCSDDIEWTIIGQETIKGKQALRQWMAHVYVEPPKFVVSNLIAEGDFVTAVGSITSKSDGRETQYSYCDVWRFHNEKMVELQAFVIEIKDPKIVY